MLELEGERANMDAEDLMGTEILIRISDNDSVSYEYFDCSGSWSKAILEGNTLEQWISSFVM